jgi:hypothetical protein
MNKLPAGHLNTIVSKIEVAICRRPQMTSETTIAGKSCKLLGNAGTVAMLCPGISIADVALRPSYARASVFPSCTAEEASHE